MADIKHTPSARGFARKSPAERRAIAQKGGRAAHAKGKAHTFTSEEARRAGQKGGRARKRRTGEVPGELALM
jgi:hypothetical protein